jgi:arylsulfatase A-like enzyme
VETPLNRREFLKIASLLPFLSFRVPVFLQEMSSGVQNQDRPNILILVFDALSAKNMSVYGYNRETTPNLARFARRAMIYHSHYAAGNFTTPGTASILTGVYPWSHRAFHYFGTVRENYARRNMFNLVGAGDYYDVAYTHNNLANILLNQFDGSINELKPTRELCLFSENWFADKVFLNDYNLAFVRENEIFQGLLNDHLPSSLFLSEFHQLWRVVNKRRLQNQYISSFPRGIPSLNGSLSFFLLEDAIDWIGSQIKNFPQPFLGYFHLLPPHAPYTTRREFVNIFDDGWNPPPKKPSFFSPGYSDDLLNQKRREYDEYIAYADAEFGRLYDFLEQSGLLENTYLVITSDHGEMFERGILAHETPTLYEPVIRVPLIISRPGKQQREEIFTPTSCVDLLPTLLQLTGLDIPSWCEGSVLPPFKKNGSQNNIFSVEAKNNPKHAPLTKATFSLARNEYKLIHYLGYDDRVPKFELFDIANDPEERQDLFDARKSVSAELVDILKTKLEAVNQPYL